MKNLIIIGCGGFGREVKEVTDKINEQTPTWNFLGFIDEYSEQNTIEGDVVLGNLDYLFKLNEKEDFYAVVAIASIPVRKRIVKACEEHNIRFATLVHPMVETRGNEYTFGEGCIICSKAEFAINTHIGRHCIFNTGSGLGHDSVVGDFTDFMPDAKAMGDCKIGSGCYFGVRATIINGLNITDNTTIGACGCVVKDITQAGTYVGVPVKMIKQYIAEDK